MPPLLQSARRGNFILYFKGWGLEVPLSGEGNKAPTADGKRIVEGKIPGIYRPPYSGFKWRPVSLGLKNVVDSAVWLDRLVVSVKWIKKNAMLVKNG